MEKHSLICDQCECEIATTESGILDASPELLTLQVLSKTLKSRGTFHFCSVGHLTAWLKEQRQ